jgi:hypothetical protein
MVVYWRMEPQRLLAESNRGLLMDLVALGVNLLGVTMLEGFFLGVLRRANASDPSAMRILFACSVALLFLAPLGATLKRWHHHQRMEGAPAAVTMQRLNGCLFNPIFYFCLVAVIFAAVNAFIMQGLFGRSEPSATVFVTSIFGGIALIITHTVLVYRFFSAPKQAPRSAFMRGPASAMIGDACLFLNMLLFQLIWNLLSFAGLGPPGGAVEFIARLLVLCFLALLLYFPPRMFYLSEDAGKPRTWLMIFLANAPVIARLLLGWSARAP